MRLPQIITSLLDTDLYKFSMGQAILHQFLGYKTTWTFRCRDADVVFTPEMVDEIRDQIRAYCDLRFTEDELQYLDSIPWIKGNYVDFLRLWRPNLDDFEISTLHPSGLSLQTRGTWLNTSMYEIPTLAIVNEVYFRMQSEWATPGGGATRRLTYDDLMDSFRRNLDEKCEKLLSREYLLGTFSEFGTRRRLSSEAQRLAVERLVNVGRRIRVGYDFVGTSNVLIAKDLGINKVGTMAHEWIMCAGQGNHKHNPAYSNWYALEAWIREYGVLNGIALTDTITTECFLRDFRLTYATLFSGVRHDSGDPVAWAERVIAHYEALGVDPRSKTLLFSDGLNFERATRLFEQFHGRAHVAFGIGTYLTNDTLVRPLNIVMKTTRCNGQDVAKLSDADGKGMCKNPDYVDYLRRCIGWRLAHEHHLT